ncbi:MAG: hypothetical protein K6E91_06900 [Butyrivibrio sp.]|nr:hypothetical protein [Butyrivibrio sp.]
MSYTSFGYYVLVAVIVLVYYLIPRRARWIALLSGSLIFYYLVSSGLSCVCLFILSIAICFTFGILLEKKRTRLCLGAGIVLTALPLILTKTDSILGSPFERLSGFSFIVPVGLSFYTLQMVAYLADIYNGKFPAQRNPLKFALFTSFFPQIIQGPIPRYDALAKELYDGNDFDLDSILSGIQLIIWGFFLKFMIADKAAIPVNTVFDSYSEYGGGVVILAGVLYSIQLYTDFLSCTTLAQGVAQMLGIHVQDNFFHPYFAVSIKDFWRRWHMSLSSWLRDYIYIPLGGSRRGSFRRYLNVFITFAVSGLWHGNSFKFIFWGLLHAVYQIAERVLDRPKVPKFLRTVITFILAMLAWVIFRADTLGASFAMMRSMVTGFDIAVFTDNSIFSLGLDEKEFTVLVLSIAVLFGVSLLQEKGIEVRKYISERSLVVRWGVYLLSIWVIWIFGTYGFGFDASEFIYGGF